MGLDLNINKAEEKATHKQILKIMDMVFILSGKTVFKFTLEGSSVNLNSISKRQAGRIIRDLLAKIRNLDMRNCDALGRIEELDTRDKYIILIKKKMLDINMLNL